jgi:hypothetical protein
MRERASPARGERCSGLCYGENASMVHRYCWTLWTVGSRMKRSDGCDWLDLQVDRTVWDEQSFNRVWRGTPKLGTPGDVAQRDQSLDYFKGWDVFGFNLVL